MNNKPAPTYFPLRKSKLERYSQSGKAILINHEVITEHQGVKSIRSWAPLSCSLVEDDGISVQEWLVASLKTKAEEYDGSLGEVTILKADDPRQINLIEPDPPKQIADWPPPDDDLPF